MNGIFAGAVAGAVGSTALNLVTYVDMVVRGRSESEVPSAVAGRITEDLADVDLGAPERDASAKEAREAAGNRRSAIGALLGYVSGLGVGAAYGLVRRRFDPPLPVAGVALGAAAMAGSDIPAIALGTTDPREWGVPGWLADVVPHLAYGFATAAAYEALTNGR